MGSLKVNGLAKSFGIRTLFTNVSFEIAGGDKIGFVGANGVGKSTLIKILLGSIEPDEGNVKIEQGTTIGYVEQQANFHDGTLENELYHAFDDIIALESKKIALENIIANNNNPAIIAEYGRIVSKFEELGGYDFESKIKRVAFGLGFSDEDLSKKVSHFSGGQKTRICLAKALLREPDFLFLDEPTNHLDIKMVEWLEKFLRSYKGGLLLISHDRYFLDRVTNRIFELDNKIVTTYAGNYTYYIRVRNERRIALQNAYEKQQDYIRKTEEYIRRYRAGIKAKQARGRESQLKRIERIIIPPEEAVFNHFAFVKPDECAERVLELEDISFAYGGDNILNKISLLIRRQDGVGLIGANGEGKTTLLRLLMGELKPISGTINIGNRVKIGYFSQEHDGLNLNNTILEELLYDYGLDEELARRYLGAFLFKGDEVFRLVEDLSGGERARLAFLKLMLTGANFLILDEPTNHLDIPAREAVEEALMSFPGTFIVVSHDRYFLDKVTSITLELIGGRINEYLGNYNYYQMKKIAETEGDDNSEEYSENRKNNVTTISKKYITKTSSINNKNIKLSHGKREEMTAKIEAMITMAEIELKGLEYEMNKLETQTDIKRSQEIAEEYHAKEIEIEGYYKRWEALTDI